MTNRSDEPQESGSEADILGQTQELDGTGTVSEGPDVSSSEANVADALEQGAVIDDEEDDYPHQAEQTDQ
jgi:hypothetical protein